MSLHLGYEIPSGAKVEIPTTHIFISATTGRGKSVAAEALITRAKEQGLRVVVVDPKDPADYYGIGKEHPLVIKGISDPLTIKRLLEASSKLWLRKELPELIQVCREGDSWEAVLEKVRERRAGKVHPIVKERLDVLELLLSRLIAQMKSQRISKTLNFNAQVIRIGLQRVGVDLQQLVVKDLAEILLEQYSDVILFVDEFHRFIPRNMPSACRDALVRLIQEGRAKKIWLFGCNQTITTVDEQVRKQMQVWALGGQTELNEADRVLDQALSPLGMDRRDVYRLGVGQFVVNNFLDGWSKLVYVQPTWSNDEDAMDVARGIRNVRDFLRPEPAMLTTPFTQDEMTVGLFERLRVRVERLEGRVNALV